MTRQNHSQDCDPHNEGQHDSCRCCCCWLFYSRSHSPPVPEAMADDRQRHRHNNLMASPVSDASAVISPPMVPFFSIDSNNQMDPHCHPMTLTTGAYMVTNATKINENNKRMLV